MRRTVTAAFAILASSTAIALGAAPASAAVHTDAPTQPAYFVMTDITHEHFVVKLTDPMDIAHARDLLSGETTDQPHLMAIIKPDTAPYNPRWSFHTRPDTVEFFDFATEVCDATIPYVEEHLDEAGGAFLPGYRWCDWSSRLVREIPAQ
ncbi:calmodulin-binding protein [Actinospica durhamensis]|uniref:Calmodulin-binding protein n=1 Tax=Actinospica durhamensis TaxID=1508375 RepID=A0A941EYT9_9ACTN|nr:calmodulin-binding protein [Actinospica durhamensis]MBR7839013.1 calmodulin-binding protein [Actinospica durhamensis]